MAKCLAWSDYAIPYLARQGALAEIKKIAAELALRR